jgi:excinuclease ABC subunit C
MESISEKPDLQPLLQDVPHKPGVYLMRDRFKRVIYVGKARDLRKRVSNYFLPSRRMTADAKTRALIESIWSFEIHTVRSESEALLLEGKLIKDYRPKYNISFRDDKRFLLVKVDEKESWPRFRLARFRKDDGARYFGPYAHAGALRQTLNILRRKFGVLTFGRGEPTPRELKYSCYQVPSRLSDLTVDQYRERVAQACELLEGGEGSQELIQTLRTEMQEAAAKLDFEKAAELRNMMQDLKRTTKPMRRFTRMSLPTTIDPEKDLAELQEVLGLSALPLVMECFDISNISTTHVVASMVAFRDGVPDRANYRRYRIKTVDGQDDFASMAEVVQRRYSRALRVPGDSEKTLPVRLPDLVIVDGGRGQLGMAWRELQRLGLQDLPLIGLAKEFEEIYRPGDPLPVRLSENSGALRLLQRIRDEAHRVANGYHTLLMKRRISESVLDDCPGVSQKRKQALLRQFGSVQRIRLADEDALGKVEGISPRLAGQIVEFLRARSSS